MMRLLRRREQGRRKRGSCKSTSPPLRVLAENQILSSSFCKGPTSRNMLMQASRQHDKLFRQFADIGRREKFLKLNAKVCLKRLPCTSRSNPVLAEIPLFLAIQFAVISPIQIPSCREIEEICFFVIFIWMLAISAHCGTLNLSLRIQNCRAS